MRDASLIDYSLVNTETGKGDALRQPSRSVRSIRRHLFGPYLDFLLLGGGSLIALCASFLLSAETARAPISLMMLLLANFINHPHFAHSYQIFYRRFSVKLRDRTSSRTLRMRYAFAGIVIPLLLTVYFVIAFALSEPRMLGVAINAMGFIVGWHYVKQGYGMAMLDSVKKRRFFTESLKKLLLINGYACWIFGWTHANRVASARDYWGVQYFSLGVPDWFYAATLVVVALTSAAALVALYRFWRADAVNAPVNGILAYLITLYVWTAFVYISPLFLLVVPAFHSLQYLVVVWRLKLNANRAAPDADWRLIGGSIMGLRWPSLAALRFSAFILLGTILGFLGFWLIPLMLDRQFSFYQADLGGHPFLVAFWVSINIHHYFLDNVMWRRDNTDTREYLFI